MSLTAERPAAEAAVSCERCGAPLEADQEWCLECGSARTLIHRPPDWRVPAAIVGGVVVLVLAALVVVLIRLSADANRLAAEQSVKRPASTATRTAASTSRPAVPAAATPTPPSSSSSVNPSVASPAASAGKIASWPVGLGGWTVVLFASSSRASAAATARHIAASGTPVGLLDSSQHPRLTPGLWVVFSGRYPTAAAASAAVLKLQAAYPSAHIRLVGAPGA